MLDPKAPVFLSDLQTWFGEIETKMLSELGKYQIPIYDEDLSIQIHQKMTNGPLLTAEQRIGLYNQQYWWRLFNVLQSHYPTLTRLFLNEFNEAISLPYLKKYPVGSSLHELGDKLPDWINEEYFKEDRNLILPLAQIDAAYHRLWFAPKKQPLINVLVDQQIFLQPYIALFAMHADLFAFRRDLLNEDPNYWATHDLPEIQRSKNKRYFVQYRQEVELIVEEISEAEHKLLSSFQQGSSIQKAIALLEEQEADLPIGSWFKTWASRCWFTTQ